MADDTKSLQVMIAKYTTAEMLQEITVEHKKGRILMIGNTNCDAQRSVNWDIGANAIGGQEH